MLYRHAVMPKPLATVVVVTVVYGLCAGWASAQPAPGGGPPDTHEGSTARESDAPARHDAPIGEAAHDLRTGELTGAHFGVGFVHRRSNEKIERQVITLASDTYGALAFEIRYGEMLDEQLGVFGTFSFSLYDFEPVGDGFAWLFQDAELAFLLAPYTIWFIPLLGSHNVAGMGAIFLFDAGPHSAYFEGGIGLQVADVDGFMFGAAPFAGVGMELSQFFSMELRGTAGIGQGGPKGDLMFGNISSFQFLLGLTDY